MRPPTLSAFALMTLALLAAGCAKRPVAQAPPPPPPPKQNIFALLAEPDGKVGRIVVSNSAGQQELTQASQAVRVERADVSPTAPYLLDPADVRRLFGPALDALPPGEIGFTLYFDEGRDDLNPASLEQLPSILAAIQERHSTAITVIGHTDTTGDSQSNYQLGMRRARRVASYLRERNVEDSGLFVDSHGDTNLLVKTPPKTDEPKNRRVEVIVR